MLVPHGREARPFAAGLMGVGRIFAGVLAALTLMGMGVIGLRTDVLGMRHWPGSGDQSPQTQLLPDTVPLVTRVAQPTVSKTGPGATTSAPVAQPTSPTASSTPLGPGGT